MKRCEEWIVAYRQRLDPYLLPDDPSRPFTVIPNTWRYWCADPHLLEHQGQTYVFAELYDRVLRRGVIGYCQLTDHGPTSWKVALKNATHLSYPQIFVDNGSIYMIPESCAQREIAVYRAVSFPNCWEKCHILKGHCVAVDSTFFTHNDISWMQTLEYVNDRPAFRLYRLQGGVPAVQSLLLSENDEHVRPGGSLFVHQEKLIRPAQDCTESYGCALNIYQVNELSTDAYGEELLTRITPSRIRSDLRGDPQGIHTYNISSKYEVIDLKQYKIDLLSYIMRPVWSVWYRVRKLLRR